MGLSLSTRRFFLVSFSGKNHESTMTLLLISTGMNIQGGSDISGTISMFHHRVKK
jgi:hypothetical protein